METEAYIALGSNLGDRELNLLMAVAALGKLPGCRVTALSGFYETSPVGMPDGTPAFYNGVVRLCTTLKPLQLLHALQQIEQEQFGRAPSSQPMSRRMDLDLLLYGNEQLAEPGLTVPHPRMHLRRFVLLPLSEIAADFREPARNLTIAELLANLASDEQVTRLE